MLQLTAFVEPEKAVAIDRVLRSTPGVRHLSTGAPATDGLVSISAHIDEADADDVIAALSSLGIDDRTAVLSRQVNLLALARTSSAVLAAGRGNWTEIVGRARENSQLAVVYLLYMAAAGVIAGTGVVTGSSILVVGAMAVSPDLLPISACAVGLVEHRWRLALRAGRALAIGLAATATAACLAALMLRIGGRIDGDLVLADSVLGPSLTTIGPGTVFVAAAAGLAGMLAFETAGAAAIGVAISVTTVPAAAYIGDALALGRTNPMGGAMLVLLTNVTTIMIASTATLWVQQRHRERARERERERS